MVKVDASRDYYGDLELPPGASDADIKKQFRKLALLYHPDRNPGKELENNARFQAIQAAHEVLGDPEKRGQYDQDRRKGNVNNTFSRPSPPRRQHAAYQAHSNFAPPPRRNARPAPGRDTPPANTGAERYTNSNFPKPRPQSATSSFADAKERQNIFNAWQHMNNAQKQHAQSQQQGQRGQPFHGARRPANPPPESFGTQRPRTTGEAPFPQRSAWEEVNRPPPSVNRQPSGRVPKRGGFDPSTPEGDEGPASASAMYGAPRANKSNHARFENGSVPDLPPRAQAPTARRPNANNFRSQSGDDIPYAESNRVNSQYAGHPDEETSTRAERLRRSASTRLGDPGSQSTLYNTGRRRSADESATGRAPNFDGFVPGRPFEVYSSSEESEGRSKQPPHEPRGRTPSSGSSGTGVSEDSGIPATDSNSRPKAEPGTSWTRRPAVSPLGRARSLEEQNLKKSREQEPEDEGPEDQSFARPMHGETFPQSAGPEMRSRSSDRSLDGDNTFQSAHSPSAERPGMYRSRSNQNVPPLQGQFHSRPHPPSPMASPDAAQKPPPSPPRSSHAAPSSPHPHASFNDEQRQGDVEEGNWASRWANPQGQSASSTRPMANSRRSRGSNSFSNRPSTMPADTPRSAVEDESGPATGAPAQNDTENLDGDAMDIDSGPSPVEPQRPSIVVEDQTAPSGPKHVYVEPSRPDFRDEGRQSTYGDILPPPHPPIPPPTSRQGSHTSAPPLPSRNSSNISMKDFRHVAPFKTGTGGGMQDMNDLSSNLPFQSQPSNVHPARATNDGSSARVELPKLPKCPLLPSDRVTPDAWAFYLQQMNVYLSEWNKFNADMVRIFQERAAKQTEMQKGPAGGMVDGWLGAVPETSSLGGWDSYVQELREDERLRKHWNVANERHLEAVERHGRLRSRVMQGGMRS